MARGTITATIHLDGVEDFDERKILREASTAAANAAYEGSIANAAPHRKTGEMEEGIGFESNGADGYEVYNNVRHSLFVHEPTRPHLITPRRAKALHFFHNGQEVFAKSVNHPGYEGDPFMERAWEDSHDVLEDSIVAGVEREWGGG